MILDAFQEVVQEARFEGELRKADMKGFKSAWKRKDPKQTFRMNAADLPELLREIGPPMGVNKDTEMHHVWDEVSELDLYVCTPLNNCMMQIKQLKVEIVTTETTTLITFIKKQIKATFQS